MFKVNNKDTRTTPKLEQVNAGWAASECILKLLITYWLRNYYIMLWTMLIFYGAIVAFSYVLLHVISANL